MNHSKDVIIIIMQNANDWEPGRLENFVVRVEYYLILLHFNIICHRHSNLQLDLISNNMVTAFTA
jgi:hypothetical protein